MHSIHIQSSQRAFSSVLPLLLFSLLVLHPTPAFALNDDASVTIDHLTAYTYQRSCGKGCIQNKYDSCCDIANELGCSWNGCVCGTQYRAAATSFVSSCWSQYCGTSSVTVLSYDIQSALAIFYDYCSGNGYAGADVTVNQASAATTTTDFGTSTGGEDSVTSTGTAAGGGTGAATVYQTHLTVVTALTTAASETATGGGQESGTRSVETTTPSTITANVYIRSTFLQTVSPSPPPPPPSTATDTTAGSGIGGTARTRLSTSDQIALGVGLGLGIPTLIATVWLCCIQTRSHFRGL